MTEQIAAQQSDLRAANRQLDERRRITETVLRGVTSGVIGLSADGHIEFANAMARDLLSVRGHINPLEGQSISAVLPEIAEQIDHAEGDIQQRELKIETAEGESLTYRIRLAQDERKTGAGVITLDDITPIQKAQKQAAWADIARRIAHEVKNPLTPIQLAAERLQRKYAPHIEKNTDVFYQCTDTIIQHVDTIRHMINEFSDFARLPSANIQQQHDIVALTRNTLTFYEESYPIIQFSFDFSHDVLNIDIDPAQIQQVLTNVVKNAIESVEESAKKQKKIAVMISRSGSEEHVILSVIDNGPGFQVDNPEEFLKPYVSKKDHGSGLGLAIVKKIMDDHKGRLVLGALPNDLKLNKALPKLKGAQINVLFRA